jgi:type IV pilus assembly protein PilW
VTLVELMIGLALGLLVSAALAAVFARSSAARVEIDRAGQQIEAGRLALELLRDDVHMAGYYAGYAGGAWQAAGACIPRSGVPLSAGALGWQDSPPVAPLPIQGYAWGDLPAAEPCFGNPQRDTDALILRSVDPVPTTVAAVTPASHADDYYLQVSTCADTAIDPAARPIAVAAGGPGAAARFGLHQKDCATEAPLRRLVVRAYYVGRCSVCSGAADQIPSLRMVELASASATSAALVEGVEALRLEYLLDLDGDGRPDAIRRCKAGADPCTESDWANVVGVQVRLLARSLAPSPGYRDDKSYDMGLAGVIPPANDGYRRHQFEALIAAFNRAGPREP